jgi:hypothetical protein
MSTEFSENSEDGKIFYYCNYCNYKCFKKQHIKQHILSQKHKINIFNVVDNSDNQNFKKEKIIERKMNECLCGASYKDRTGLWRHKKNCLLQNDNKILYTDEFNNKDNNKMNSTDKELIVMLLKENKELKTMMIEQQHTVLEICKNGINVTNNNSHNKTFNLNFFLNETCKDAMNITDFVKKIKLQLSDLENVGEIGYVDGISNIIVKNLKVLDITQRPIHCTDKKRETLYIKDENKWEKEDEENNKIRKVIKQVSHKNSCLLKQYREKHPDYGKSESKYSDQYNKLIIEAMGGKGNNEIEKEDNIIKKIIKEVTIDK